MADVTAPSVQLPATPAEVAAVAPTSPPVHDQNVGPSQSPPVITFEDENKKKVTEDLRAKAIKADQDAQAARDPMTKVHKKLDQIMEKLDEILENTAHLEPTEEDEDFIADDDEEEEPAADDDEEEEAVATDDEMDGDAESSNKRTAEADAVDTAATQRRKTRRH